jgi:chorismate-pyruvate lyase
VSGSSESNELESLIELFYRQADDLGKFIELAAADLPQPYRKLLAHQHHMTVAMEQHHGQRVNVEVLNTHRGGHFYSRRILLLTESDGRVVQFGIVRLNLEFLDEAVRQEIESETVPLGRVLIEHKVMREIELLSLWRVDPSAELRALFNMGRDEVTYGRTAIIHVDGEPAVELLEIAAPTT